MKESFSISVPTFKGSPEQFAEALALLEQRIVESNIVKVYENTAANVQETLDKPVVQLVHKPEESRPTFKVLLGERTFFTGAAGGTSMRIVSTLRGAFMAALHDLPSEEKHS